MPSSPASQNVRSKTSMASSAPRPAMICAEETPYKSASRARKSPGCCSGYLLNSPVVVTGGGAQGDSLASKCSALPAPPRALYALNSTIAFRAMFSGQFLFMSFLRPQDANARRACAPQDLPTSPAALHKGRSI